MSGRQVPSTEIPVYSWPVNFRIVLVSACTVQKQQETDIQGVPERCVSNAKTDMYLVAEIPGASGNEHILTLMTTV